MGEVQAAKRGDGQEKRHPRAFFVGSRKIPEATSDPFPSVLRSARGISVPALPSYSWRTRNRTRSAEGQ